MVIYNVMLINYMNCSVASVTAELLVDLDCQFSARLSSTPEAAVRTRAALNRDNDQMSGSL